MTSAPSVLSVAKSPVASVSSEAKHRFIKLAPAAYRVRIQRQNITLQAYLPFTTPETQAAALQLAIRTRDQFLIAAGPALPKRAPAPEYRPGSRLPRSNTGIPGICETTKWVGGTREDCFSVYLGKHHEPKMKRVYYGKMRSREAALQKAIALRASVVPSSKEVSHA